MSTESHFSQVSRRAFLGVVSLAALTGLAACATGSDDSTSSSTTTSAASTTAAAAGGSLAGTAEVSFTFSGNSFKNPYYAVWVEDAAGELVKTLMLCHLSGGQDRWLNELTKWYQVSGGSDTTTEGTKPAGTYTASWDGTDSTGSKVAAGTYTFCVESAVEHGNYSYVSADVDLASAAIQADLGSDGDLTAASVKYTV